MDAKEVSRVKRRSEQDGVLLMIPARPHAHSKQRAHRRGIISAIVVALAFGSGASLAAIRQQSPAPFDVQGVPSNTSVVPGALYADDCKEDARSTVSPALCLLLHWPHGRIAQHGGFQVEEISGVSGNPIPIKVTLPAALLANVQGPVFLMFQGLPPDVSLSAGFRIRDSWAVSLKDVPSLSLNSPPGFTGSFTLTVTLRAGQNVSSRIISVRLGPVAAPAEPAWEVVHADPNDTLPSKNPPAATAKAFSDEDKAALLENASDMLKSGDFEAARLIWTELTEQGSGRAAFLLAETYDPEALRAHFVVGMQPDEEKARYWYSKAAELGDRQAMDHLKSMTPRQ